MLIKIFLLQCIKLVTPIDSSPGRQVPHADILRGILKNQIMTFSESPEGSLLDYLFHAKVAPNNTEKIDLNVLDVDNVRRIIEVAKKKYFGELMKDTRRKKEALQWHPHIVNMTIKNMEQSIYATRYRLRPTVLLRRYFRNDIHYKIALRIGSLQSIISKMDGYYGQMQNFPDKTHFIWLLILYEKMIAGDVDINHMVQRVYLLHKEFMGRMSGVNK